MLPRRITNNSNKYSWNSTNSKPSTGPGEIVGLVCYKYLCHYCTYFVVRIVCIHRMQLISRVVVVIVFALSILCDWILHTKSMLWSRRITCHRLMVFFLLVSFSVSVISGTCWYNQIELQLVFGVFFVCVCIVWAYKVEWTKHRGNT